jgi:electron transfer flavoprotein alpha subunit
MSILVLAEHNNSELKSSTLSAISAALQINENIDVLVVGSECENIVNKLKNVHKINKIILADNEIFLNPIAELISPILNSLSENYSHFVAPASTYGKNIMPRLAAFLDVSQISDIVKVEDSDTFVRPIYAGNALATVQSTDKKKVITIRSTSFDPISTEGGNAEVEKIDVPDELYHVEFLNREENKSDRPELGTARVVISGGRGLGSAKNFSLLNDIADKLNAAVGASRAAVDAGYISNDSQVGQTGKVVVPDLYIAVGISGAIQHLAGMKESKIIVAINKDEEAPIFNVSDYGLHGDLFEILPLLSSELDKLNTIQA